MKHWTYLLVLLATLGFSQSAQAKTNDHYCHLHNNCKTQRDAPVKSGDLSENGLKSQKQAAQSINAFRFDILKKVPNLGYSRVTYSMIDKDNNTYADAHDNAADIVDRSILAWLSAIFVTKEKSFMLSLDVYSDEDGKNLIAMKPLYVATYKDGFRSVTAVNDLDLNGSLGFPRLSNEIHKVKLTVRHADSNTVNLQVLESVLKAASGFGGIIPGVRSLLDEDTLVSFRAKKDDVEEVLGKFEVSTTMTRAITMQYVDKGVVAFDYDLSAPKSKGIPPVKLRVELRHQDSLLTEGGSFEAGDILTSQIHTRDNESKSLRRYIEEDDRSNDEIISLKSDAKPEVPKICREIKTALEGKLTATDIVIGLNAFVTRYADLFGKNWDSNCFQPPDIKILQSKKQITITSLWLDEQPDAPYQLSLDEQLRMVRLFNKVLTRDNDAEDANDHADTASALLAATERVLLEDEVGLLFGDGRPDTYAMSPDSLALRLSTTKRLKPGLGCYSGDIFDTDLQPNVMGTLTMLDDQPVQVLFEFEPAPANRKFPQLQRLLISYPDQDLLDRYKSGHPSRATKGCGSGFNTWTLPNT